MDKERKLIIETLQNTGCLEFSKKILQVKSKSSMKSSIQSTDARNKGNVLYTSKQHNSQVHEKIWELYSRSIALAPLMSEELALAYGNRSALLFHLQKFDDCINDIDKALEITKSVSLKDKLLSRRTTCLTVLNKDEKENSQNEKKNNTDICVSDTLLHSDNNISDHKIENLIHLSKTISISGDFCSSNDNTDKDKVEKILNEKKNKDLFDMVYLKYSEKYGRHLVAKRDIKPGEIIMIDKLYLNSHNINNYYCVCAHCLKTCWSSVPCDYCRWCMFCTEECKTEAWKKYHDIECFIISDLILYNLMDTWTLSILRLTIISIKESGNIKNLKAELRKVDKCKNILNKGFSNDKFYSAQFQSIYSLSTCLTEGNLMKHAKNVAIILLFLVKSSLLFENNLKIDSIKDLLLNDDVIFIGALLLKYINICMTNGQCVMEGSSPCRFLKNLDECSKDSCCERGWSVAWVPSMINHSCYPNIRKCFTEDMHLMVYALQPIKKNSQLFDSYIDPFFISEYLERQLLLKQYNFVCDCPPCKERWPKDLMKKTQLEMINGTDNYKTEFKLQLKYKDLYVCKGNIVPSLSIINSLSDAIIDVNAHVKQPSLLSKMLIHSLWLAFDDIYGIKLQVRNECYNV